MKPAPGLLTGLASVVQSKCKALGDRHPNHVTARLDQSRAVAHVCRSQQAGGAQLLDDRRGVAHLGVLQRALPEPWPSPLVQAQEQALRRHRQALRQQQRGQAALTTRLRDVRRIRSTDLE